MRQFEIKILFIIKVMFEIKLYCLLVNLSVTIFISNVTLKNRMKTDIEKDLKTNSFFIRKNKNRKKKYWLY